MHKGSCLCGAVTFKVVGDLPAPDAYHCSMCRKIPGHYFASSDVKRDALTVHGIDNVTWFQSSKKVRRGFCATYEGIAAFMAERVHRSARTMNKISAALFGGFTARFALS